MEQHLKVDTLTNHTNFSSGGMFRVNEHPEYSFDVADQHGSGIECILSNKKVFHETTHLANLWIFCLEIPTYSKSELDLCKYLKCWRSPLEGFNLRKSSTSDTTTLDRRISGLCQRWIATADISRMKNGSGQTAYALWYPTPSDLPPVIHIVQESTTFRHFLKCWTMHWNTLPGPMGFHWIHQVSAVDRLLPTTARRKGVVGHRKCKFWGRGFHFSHWWRLTVESYVVNHLSGHVQICSKCRTRKCCDESRPTY